MVGILARGRSSAAEGSCRSGNGSPQSPRLALSKLARCDRVTQSDRASDRRPAGQPRSGTTGRRRQGRRPRAAPELRPRGQARRPRGWALRPRLAVSAHAARDKSAAHLARALLRDVERKARPMPEALTARLETKAAGARCYGCTSGTSLDCKRRDGGWPRSRSRALRYLAAGTAGAVAERDEQDH